MLMFIKIKVTLVQVHVAVVGYFLHFIAVQFDLNYIFYFGHHFWVVYNALSVVVVVSDYFLWVVAHWVLASEIDSYKVIFKD